MQKNSFTLIELLVSMAIIGILIGIAIPSYERQVLKGRFEEAKSVILAISLAQERNFSESGSYFLGNINMINENFIHERLSIDLSLSNNFIYRINTNSAGSFYEITARLRVSVGACTNLHSISDICKQTGVADVDTWVSAYDEVGSNHFIRFRFPNIFRDDDTDLTRVENAIDYTNM